MLLIYRQEIGLLCKLIADEGGTEMGAAQGNASGIEIQMGVFDHRSSVRCFGQKKTAS